MSFNYSLLDPETQLFAQQLHATNFLLAEDPGQLYRNHAILPVEEPVAQQKPRNNGMYALIADGVHKLGPITVPDRMDKGQLHIVHAVVSGEFEVPILYAITRYKNAETYNTIFGRLNEIIGESELERIVLDFEKAAIGAAKEEFPNVEVQGCAFHLAQAWNRMANKLLKSC